MVTQKQASNSSPSQVFDELFDEGGGIIEMSSAGSVPRSSKQISDFKGASKGKSSAKDTLYSVMEECKKEQSRATPYIRCVQAAPDPVCILAFDRQINDMVRFCTNIEEFSVLGIDPTFSLGDFSVTVATYRHLLLVSKRTKIPPIMIGPIMVHQHKRKQNYHFFAASLVGLCQHICAIGTDGEVAIASSFQVQFKESKHVLCFLHVKDNLKRKLHDIGITGATAGQFLKDVFAIRRVLQKLLD